MKVVCVVFLLFIIPCKSINVTQCNVTLPKFFIYDLYDFSNIDCGCEQNCIKKCCVPGYILLTEIPRKLFDLTIVGPNSFIYCAESTFFLKFPGFNISFYDDRKWKNTTNVLNYNSGLPNCMSGKYRVVDDIYPQSYNWIYSPTDSKVYLDTSEICLDDYYFFDNGGIMRTKKTAIKCLDVNDLDFYFYCACMIISCIFLLAIFIVLFPQRNKTLQTKALLFYTFNLLMAFIPRAIIDLIPPFEGGFCVLVALLYLLFYISPILWINVICLDIYLKFSGFFGLRIDKNLERKCMLWYTIYAVFLPIAYILLIYLLNTFVDINEKFHPTIGFGSCFLRGGLPSTLYLHGPMGILFIVNIALFILTILHIRKHKKATKVLRNAESNKSKPDKNELIIYLTLMFAMGIKWSLLESIGWAVDFFGKGSTWFMYTSNTANVCYKVFMFYKFAWKKTWGEYLKERYFKLIGKKVENSNCSSVQTNNTTDSSNNVDSSTDISFDHVEIQTFPFDGIPGVYRTKIAS